MRRTQPPRGMPGRSSHDSLPSLNPALEGCESGRIGTIGNRVWGNPPWVQIPPSPPKSACQDVAGGNPSRSPGSRWPRGDARRASGCLSGGGRAGQLVQFYCRQGEVSYTPSQASRLAVLLVYYHGAMSVRKKRSVSIPPDLDAQIEAAATESGVTYSAWLADAARKELTIRAGHHAVAEIEREHGAFTAEEIADAEHWAEDAIERSRRDRARSA